MAEIEQESVRLSDLEAKRRRSRSVALGLVLGALVVLFYLMTFAKFGEMLR